MNIEKALRFNSFINSAYDCDNFMDFLRIAIMNLHKFVMYDSGMFYCAISHDCSYFKPYVTGDIGDYYTKETFKGQQGYLDYANGDFALKEGYVYKSQEILTDNVSLLTEPRKNFLEGQKKYHIACLRIVYKGQFFGEIYLHREKSKPDFSSEDMFVLNLMQPHVSTIFNLIHKKVATLSVEQGSQSKNIGMCAFDKDLAIVSSNILGLEMIKAITIFGSSILHHIKELCYSFEPDKSSKGERRTEIIKLKDSDLKIDLYHCPPKLGDQVSYMALMQYTSETQIASDYKFKFTKREADIIDSLIQGKNNSQIAGALCLSENTVKTHIKNIYTKTGANNRTELTYILMLNK